LQLPAHRIGCGNTGMAVGVSREWRGLLTLMILWPATFAHNHSVSDCFGDWSTNAHSNWSWTNVARSCFLLRTDSASEELGITSLSAVVTTGAEWLENTTRRRSIIPDISTHPTGMALPRTAWVRLNPAQVYFGCMWQMYLSRDAIIRKMTLARWPFENLIFLKGLSNSILKMCISFVYIYSIKFWGGVARSE